MILRWEFNEKQILFLFRFVNGLRADIKCEVKVYRLYSLDVAYQKALEYEKYFRIIPRCVHFNSDTHPSHPSTFPRSHPTKPVNTASPLRSTPGASSTNLAKIKTPASPSAHHFTSQIKCYHCHVKGHIASHCPQRALVINCEDDRLLEGTDELLVMAL